MKRFLQAKQQCITQSIREESRQHKDFMEGKYCGELEKKIDLAKKDLERKENQYVELTQFTTNTNTDRKVLGLEFGIDQLQNKLNSLNSTYDNFGCVDRFNKGSASFYKGYGYK